MFRFFLEPESLIEFYRLFVLFGRYYSHFVTSRILAEIYEVFHKLQAMTFGSEFLPYYYVIEPPDSAVYSKFYITYWIAVKECTDARFLPARYRDLAPEDVERQIGALRPFV